MKKRFDLTVEVIRKITEHHTLLVASGVAFSCTIGLLPALIALVAVYGMVASPTDVESNLGPLIDALPSNGAELLVDQLQNVTASSNAQVTIGLVVGLIGSAWAVSSALNAIVMAVRIAHEMDSPHTWVRGRLFALRLSVIGVVTTAAMIWLVVVLPPVLDNTNVGSLLERAIGIVRWPLVFVISSTALALLYRVIVGHRTGRYHAVSVGAVFGTTMWVMSTYLLGQIYAHVDKVESAFGSLGAVAALMGWLYLSAVSVLVGAEIDGVRHRATVDPSNDGVQTHG